MTFIWKDDDFFLPKSTSSVSRSQVHLTKRISTIFVWWKDKTNYLLNYCPKCDNFACLHNRQYQTVLHLKRWFFLPKSASSVSWPQAHIAKRKTNYLSNQICVRVFRAPNATILLVDIPVKIKMSFIWKDDDFFFAKIDIFCKSIAGPLSEA